MIFEIADENLLLIMRITTMNSRISLYLLIILLMGSVQSCNYNYYRGVELESQGRFEEANIEFHRAYTGSPGNEEFKEAYSRTAKLTTEDLLERYQRYIEAKKYQLAFRRLEQAQILSPENPVIKKELKKWFRILLAGKIELAQIKSLRNQIPFSDQIFLEVRINSPNVSKVLKATVDYQTQIFSVDDILYDPPQNLLMFYSLNSIGVALVNNLSGQKRFKRFIDFKTPVLVNVQGTLKDKGQDLVSISGYYPVNQLKNSHSNTYWYPARGIRYSLQLDETEIKVNSSVPHIDFLPQLLYINRKDKRYFLDFGHLQLFQKKTGGLWSFRRILDEKRVYLMDLRKNLILNPYFYYREGGYPFVAQKTNEQG